MVMPLEFLQTVTGIEGNVTLPGWMLAAAVGGPWGLYLWERRRSAAKEDRAEEHARRVEEQLNAYLSGEGKRRRRDDDRDAAG